jgi:hypothetical protein
MDCTGERWVSPTLTIGLGNRLFQFAAAAVLEEFWDTPLVVCDSQLQRNPHGEAAAILRLYSSVRKVDAVEDGVELGEPTGALFTRLSFPEEAPAPKIVLRGYFQHPGYFPKDLGRLDPDWNTGLGGAEIRAWLERDCGLAEPTERARRVALHVRLGDFCKLAHHQVPLQQYYLEALRRVQPDQIVRVFSDERDACAGLIAGWRLATGLTFELAEDRSDVESLYEMSLCLGGTITANSTFSWWGAWFAHRAGSPWASFPSRMGQGLPDSVGCIPAWGSQINV